MCENLYNLTELRFLWKSRGNKNYDFKNFVTTDGTSVSYILFQDLQNRRNVLGKIVTDPREGEAYHWPRLIHENLAPLLDIASINEKVSIYILPALSLSLKTVIHDKRFMMDVNSFNRKRAYAKDILLALEYLHSKSLCVTNLTERIVGISDSHDKAVLYNFECIHLIGKATKEDLDLPILYQPPELETEYFDPISAETWACGVMFLQIFTNHALPSAFVGEEVQRVLKASVKEINYGIIKEAAPGAEINVSMIEELKMFLGLFLVEDPKLRIHAQKAVTSAFLKGTRRVEVKDAFNSALWKSNNDLKFRRTFDKYSSHKKNLTSPFEDIYLKEVTECRNKLKSSPFTNKFINLKFIPHAESMTKCPAQNKCSKDEKNGMPDRNKVKSIVQQKRSPELDSGDKCNELQIGDNKVIFSTSKIVENSETSIRLSNISNSNLESTSSDVEDIGDVMKGFSKHKELYDSISDLYDIDDAIKSIKKNANFNETEFPQAQLDKHRSLSDSDISLDSLDLLEDDMKEANDGYRKREFLLQCTNNFSSCDSKSEKSTEKFFPAEDEKSSTSKIAENSETSSRLSNINNSNLESKSSDVEIIGDVMKGFSKHKELYDSISDLYDIDDAIKSIKKNANFNETEFPEAQFDKHRSLSDSDISLDSLHLLENDIKEAIDGYRKREFLLQGSNSFSSCDSKSENNAEKLFPAEDEKSSRLKVVHVNSVFKIKSALEQNLKKDGQFRNDPYNSNSSDVKDNKEEMVLAPSIMNNSEDIHLNPEIEDKNRSEIRNLETTIDGIESFSLNSALHDSMKPDNLAFEMQKVTSINYQNDLKTDKNEETKTSGGELSFGESTNEVKSESVSSNGFQSARRIDSKFFRSDSYKMAILKRYTAKHGTVPNIEETKLKTPKRLSIFKIPFIHKNVPAIKLNKEKDDKVKIKKIENTEECVSEDPAEEISEINKRQTKNKWMRYLLCLGIK